MVEAWRATPASTWICSTLCLRFTFLAFLISQLAHLEPHAGTSLNGSLNGSISDSRDGSHFGSSFVGSRDRRLLLDNRGASVPVHGDASGSGGVGNPSDSHDTYGGSGSGSKNGSRNRGGNSGGSSSGLAEGAWEPAAYAVDSSSTSSRRSSAVGGGRGAPSSSTAATASREPRAVPEKKRSSASMPRPPPPQQASERFTRGSRAPSEPQDSGSDGAPVRVV